MKYGVDNMPTAWKKKEMKESGKTFVAYECPRCGFLVSEEIAKYMNYDGVLETCPRCNGTIT